MTPPKTSASSDVTGRTGRRREFTEFYGATYPSVVGEMLALTDDLELAHAVVGMSYVAAWQAWPAVRTLEWPMMWVRSDAFRRLRRPSRTQRLLEHATNPVEPVRLAPEDQALVAGLRWLPVEQRFFVVLHFMAQVPTTTIATWFDRTVDDVETTVDSGFDALVSIVEQSGGGVGQLLYSDLADEAAAEEAQARFDEMWVWTAEALEDCGHRLRIYLPTPPAALVFRRARVKKVARRGAPITAAAAAACIGFTALLSPTPTSTAEAAASPSAPLPTVIEQPDQAGPPLTATPFGTSPVPSLSRITRVAGTALTTDTAQIPAEFTAGTVRQTAPTTSAPTAAAAPAAVAAAPVETTTSPATTTATSSGTTTPASSATTPPTSSATTPTSTRTTTTSPPVTSTTTTTPEETTTTTTTTTRTPVTTTPTKTTTTAAPDPTSDTPSSHTTSETTDVETTRTTPTTSTSTRESASTDESTSRTTTTKATETTTEKTSDSSSDS